MSMTRHAWSVARSALWRLGNPGNACPLSQFLTFIDMLTIGISTRDRLNSLLRCVRSLLLVGELVREIIIVDDNSVVPLEGPLREALGDFPVPLTVIRQGQDEGYIVARNLITQAAATEFVLHMDDDAYILDPSAVRRALDVIGADEAVAAVALAQAEVTGEPWPAQMQAAPVDYPCYTPSFIGFAHLLRRDVFLALGGYRELLHFYGEEKEYCLRVLDAGYHVVYLPDALVPHVSDPGGRSKQKWLRYSVRNDCLGALFNEPILMMLATIPLRFAAYFRIRRASKINDPGGAAWIIGQLFSAASEVCRSRRPARWHTLRRWREMRRIWPPYHGPRWEKTADGTASSLA